MAISVVVVAYRQREALLETLASITDASAHVSAGTELIVVDNGDLAPLIRAHFPHARVIEPGLNTGFAGGVRLGISRANGSWIALVNDDARIEPEALAALLAAGERSPRIGSVAAQVRFAGSPNTVNSAGISVDRLGVATERLAGWPASAAAHASEVFGATACFALYRRSMLSEIGGFDSRFFAYLEDVDVAWRARATGWVSVYEPEAVAHHRGSASSGHGSATKYFLVGRNRVWLLAKNATARQLALALPGIAAYDAAYVAYVALTDRTLAPLHGRIAGLRRWRTLRRESRGRRRPVKLDVGSWKAGLRQHRAYDQLSD